MLREVITERVHYFLNENGLYHGEYRDWHKNGRQWEKSYYINGGLFGEFKLWDEDGQLVQHCFYKDSSLHGECKTWNSSGEIELHLFYVDGKSIEIDYPKTDEELMLFKLKYDLQLLPVEHTC